MGNFCTNCGAKLVEGSNNCHVCGQPVNGSPAGNAPNSENVVNKFTRQINEMAGGRGAVKLRIRDLFTDVFKKHSLDEANYIFTCGTKDTTPPDSAISTSWPKPWLYSRVFFMFVITFLLLQFCVQSLENDRALPGMMFIGALAAPFALLIFFQEVNAPRNISFYEIAQMFFVGGVSSLVITLILYEIAPNADKEYTGAVIIGIVEELGKLAIVAYYIYKKPNIKYMLNGLLIGAAIGAGFATFETAGYIFENFFGGYIYALTHNLSDQAFTIAYGEMMNVTYLRAVLSPGGHVAWAAISGAAIMLVKKNMKFDTSMLVNSRFLKFFAISVVLHAIWDMPIQLTDSGKGFLDNICLIQDILVVIAWVVILVLIQVGLNQISNNDFNTTQQYNQPNNYNQPTQQYNT